MEATLFHQPARHRYVLGLVNFQPSLPNIPIHDIEITLRLGVPIREVKSLPDGELCLLQRQANHVTTFTAPTLETLRLFAIEVG